MTQKIVCPRCGWSSRIEYRSTKKPPFVCRKCGHEWGEEKANG